MKRAALSHANATAATALKASGPASSKAQPGPITDAITAAVAQSVSALPGKAAGQTKVQGLLPRSKQATSGSLSVAPARQPADAAQPSQPAHQPPLEQHPATTAAPAQADLQSRQAQTAAVSATQPEAPAHVQPQMQPAAGGGDNPAAPLTSGRAAVSLASLPGLPPPKKARTSSTDLGAAAQNPGPAAYSQAMPPARPAIVRKHSGSAPSQVVTPAWGSQAVSTGHQTSHPQASFPSSSFSQMSSQAQDTASRPPAQQQQQQQNASQTSAAGPRNPLITLGGMRLPGQLGSLPMAGMAASGGNAAASLQLAGLRPFLLPMSLAAGGGDAVAPSNSPFVFFTAPASTCGACRSAHWS